MKVSMKVSAVSDINRVYFQKNFKTVNHKEEDQYIYPPQPFHKLKTAAYSASVLAAGLGIVYIGKKLNVSEFAKVLSRTLKSTTRQNVDPQNFNCFMSGDELLNILPKLNAKNYEASSQNISNYIFKADLHSHSNYADGKGYVKNILEDALDYADILYKKTKQKFIFAITDQDTTESTKEILDIVASNPKRYKNIRIVPAMEVSFVHKAPNSNNECEVSELLVYGINPYSEKINKFTKNIKEKRLKVINDFIKEASTKCNLTKFSYNEFEHFYDAEQYGNFMNIHWRVNHYVQTKHAVTILASKTNQNAEFLYDNIMKDHKGASLGQLHEYNLVPSDIVENQELNAILQKYLPRIENDKIITQSENAFEEIIDAFKDEKNIFMAFAKPLYFSEKVKKPYEEFKYYINNSKGLIKASESYFQSYDNRDANKIKDLQSLTESLKLLNIGGRENKEFCLF